MWLPMDQIWSSGQGLSTSDLECKLFGLDCLYLWVQPQAEQSSDFCLCA